MLGTQLAQKHAQTIPSEPYMVIAPIIDIFTWRSNIWKELLSPAGFMNEIFQWATAIIILVFLQYLKYRPNNFQLLLTTSCGPSYSLLLKNNLKNKISKFIFY